eukprot:3227705-Rhodomonas_salina.1
MHNPPSRSDSLLPACEAHHSLPATHPCDANCRRVWAGREQEERRRSVGRAVRAWRVVGAVGEVFEFCVEGAACVKSVPDLHCLGLMRRSRVLGAYLWGGGQLSASTSFL